MPRVAGISHVARVASLTGVSRVVALVCVRVHSWIPLVSRVSLISGISGISRVSLISWIPHLPRIMRRMAPRRLVLVLVLVLMLSRRSSRPRPSATLCGSRSSGRIRVSRRRGTERSALALALVRLKPLPLLEGRPAIVLGMIHRMGRRCGWQPGRGAARCAGLSVEVALVDRAVRCDAGGVEGPLVFGRRVIVQQGRDAHAT